MLEGVVFRNDSFAFKERKDRWSRSKSMQDFEQRLMVGFPYTLEEFVSGSSRQKEKEDLVSKILFIFFFFLSKNILLTQ